MAGAVKKVAQVVVGAAVGFAQGGPWGAVAGAALAFYASQQQEKLSTGSSVRNSEPAAQTVRSSKAPVRFILGKASTGGVLVWAQEQAGAQGEGEWIHMVYVLAEGRIAGIDAIFLGEQPITDFGDSVSHELVVDPTQVNTFLKANCPDWKDSQIGRGLSYVRLSLRYSAEKFPSGIPDVRFQVRGDVDVYDPRTGKNAFTENTALHLLWYLRNRCGVPDDEIIMQSFASGANVCDEAVINADGTGGIRYRTGCVIGADEPRTQVQQKLEAACGGKLIRVGGRWMLQVGAYYGPYDFEITEDMVVGTISGTTEPGNDAAINTVRGTFIDPSQSWTETDYPEVSVEEWVAEDGGEAAETLSFSYVNDPYQPQRLANIELRRRRAGGSLTIPMNFAGYNCRPGRVVRVNLPTLNILGEFIVTDWAMGAKEACSVSVSQYDQQIFDDAVGEPYNPLGFISLPTGGLGTPTGLMWMSDSSAEVVQGTLSWTMPAGIVTECSVVVRQGNRVIQAHTVPAPGVQQSINGLPSGMYSLSVSARGPLARSGEASININVDGPPVPETCVIYSSFNSITLVPGNVLYHLNGGTYEYFYNTKRDTSAANATYLGQGLSFTHTGLAFATNYFYYVRASNAYGKSDFLFVVASTSSNVGEIMDVIGGQIGETELSDLVRDKIELITSNGKGSVNDRINDAKKEMESLIADVTDALVYDKDKVGGYKTGQIVRQGQSLYQARKDVPTDASGASAPPNATYWQDIGTLLQTANALASQVERNRTDIVQTGKDITAQAERINAVNTKITDPDTGLTANAKGLSSLKSAVQQIGTDLSATAQKVDGVTVQINPDLTGDDAWNIGEETVYAGTVTIQSVSAEANLAQAQRTDLVVASIGNTNASLLTEQIARATADSALSQRIETTLAQVGQTNAALVSEQTARATADSALGQRVDSTQVQLGETSAAVSTISRAQAKTDGGLSAMSSIKTQVSVDGYTYLASLGVGVENDKGVVTSQILLAASRVAIFDPNVSGSVKPLLVTQGNQVFINDAVINKAFIQELVLGMTITSKALAPNGKPVLKIDFQTGLMERNSGGNGMRREETANYDRYWDEQTGVLVIEIGQLS
ncbi:phage tail tip fiber protein [Pseudomonas syringae]|uniref:phage tail tip fiber protein n=1 Tax=Pseudomonas syringae TaxID=317 RepID=UPI0018E5F497|nr:DUF1983 domain-containing protein [Pseudomonas syringae]MBI6740925.1 DUF1983 domain-containing protein [Pseudomonas syringae]MBI6762269.1 DUF1983 domain-containing protein [Pseudomonas syringae]MBI6828161.1 DUF1983 domain-containing protein [Pseudomonas syringae]